MSTATIFRMEISQVRRENLVKLIASYGTIEAMAAAGELNASYLSQMKNGTRDMGTRFARETEEKLGLKRGWFDTPPGNQEERAEPIPVELALFRRLSRQQREAITVILRSMLKN